MYVNTESWSKEDPTKTMPNATLSERKKLAYDAALLLKKYLARVHKHGRVPSWEEYVSEAVIQLKVSKYQLLHDPLVTESIIEARDTFYRNKYRDGNQKYQLPTEVKPLKKPEITEKTEPVKRKPKPLVTVTAQHLTEKPSNTQSVTSNQQKEEKTIMAAKTTAKKATPAIDPNVVKTLKAWAATKPDSFSRDNFRAWKRTVNDKSLAGETKIMKAFGTWAKANEYISGGAGSSKKPVKKVAKSTAEKKTVKKATPAKKTAAKPATQKKTTAAKKKQSVTKAPIIVPQGKVDKNHPFVQFVNNGIFVEGSLLPVLYAMYNNESGTLEGKADRETLSNAFSTAIADAAFDAGLSIPE